MSRVSAFCEHGQARHTIKNKKPPWSNPILSTPFWVYDLAAGLHVGNVDAYFAHHVTFVVIRIRYILLGLGPPAAKAARGQALSGMSGVGQSGSRDSVRRMTSVSECGMALRVGGGGPCDENGICIRVHVVICIQIFQDDSGIDAIKILITKRVDLFVLHIPNMMTHFPLSLRSKADVASPPEIVVNFSKPDRINYLQP
jgi:hypothetical protein